MQHGEVKGEGLTGRQTPFSFDLCFQCAALLNTLSAHDEIPVMLTQGRPL
jgi:hypothetical protein